MARLTPKQRVLKRWPKAYAYRFGGTLPWVIFVGDFRAQNTLNVQDKTAAKAWESAAKHPTVRRVGGRADG